MSHDYLKETTDKRLTGNEERAAVFLILAIFMSGRKRRILLSTPRKAFIPSKSSIA